MSALRILIVEDEAVIAQHLWMLLEDIGYEVVGRASKYSKAVDLLESAQPDLVLLDIMLGGAKDGVDVANHIRETKPGLPFIFLTSHADPKTVERAKAAKPFGYLVKPFEREDLYAAIEVAMMAAGSFTSDSAEPKITERENDEAVLSDSVFIKDKHLYFKIRFEDICYLKSDGNYVDLYTEAKRYTVRTTMKDFLTKLPENMFFKIHKSYAVNVKEVASIKPTAVVVNGIELPTTKDFREALLERLNTI